ncbi:2-amino-4-hydroxy-6-hydroxymethyldihydropteridine diphosphokinase [Rubellimicrobium sp. CFH 75288]|nr:2-amino-4-hydroxy-6-hydroxymethyldihydropteridine diphosphokinase [Rubellimicrobium sp. CFH 75288]
MPSGPSVQDREPVPARNPRDDAACTRDGAGPAAPVLALVALGANLPSSAGPPEATLRAALGALGTDNVACGPIRPSRLWRSPSWPPGGPDYVNAAAAFETLLSPDRLLGRLHALEAAFGRRREGRWTARSLDLDLLAWGDAIRPDPATAKAWRDLPPARQGREAPDGLVLPHPRLQDRAFVLLPLAEIAPSWRHPALGLTVSALLSALPAEALRDVRPLGPV